MTTTKLFTFSVVERSLCLAPLPHPESSPAPPYLFFLLDLEGLVDWRSRCSRGKTKGGSSGRFPFLSIMLWRRHNSSSSSSKSPDTGELVTSFSLSYFSFSLTCPSYFPPLSLSFRFPVLSFLAIMSGVGPEKKKKKGEDDILDTTFFSFGGMA